MPEAGRALMVIGLLIALVGAVVWLLGRSGFRGLPGDIAYRGHSVSFYVPIVTCVVLSIVLTALAWLWRWLSGR